MVKNEKKYFEKIRNFSALDERDCQAASLFEGGKVVSAVVMPPQAHRELQGKQNKTKLPACHADFK